jgi:hypothetical protein
MESEFTGDGPTQHDGLTQQIAVTGAGDRCANCGTLLASDQRYCINCGERRGKPRFTLAAPPVTEVVTTRSVRDRPWMPRPASGASLIAGIATLLLAMGVGVLIGHNSSPAQTSLRQPAAQVITVGGGAAPASAGASTGPGRVASGGGARSNKPKAAAVKAAAKAANSSAPPPPVVVKKAAAAAQKVVGSANVAPVTVTQGSACSSGQAGCSGGTFNGNFFGGG